MTNTKGSAILVVVLFMSILSLFCLSVWHSSSLLHDISLQRLLYEQRYRATQGGLNYAIVFCKKKFDQIIKVCAEHNKVYEIALEPFVFSKHISYQCNMRVSAQGKCLYLQSFLFDVKKKKVFELSCNLIKCAGDTTGKQSNTFLIKHWSVGEN